MRNYIGLFVVMASFVLAACGEPVKGQIKGEMIAHRPVTFEFSGPQLSESRETFTDYVMAVSFTTSYKSTNNYTVPGYFAADGNAAQSGASSGTIWRAHFTPPSSGTWNYKVSFKTGPNLATSPTGGMESAGYFDGASGTITIAAAQLDPSATDFSQKGMLVDVRGRYLQFNGTQQYWLKTGAGSPENMLAYADFDGTYDAGGTNFPALGEDQLHEFEPHLRDALPGDPTWQDGKGKAILGIANYYETVGVNAQYIVSMNIEGDGQDVFPYVSHTDPYVFDVSKLDQWNIVFSHFNSRGVLIDLLLTETENESIFEAWDNVAVGTDFADSRKLYYREMVARFGHLNGIVWNLGEENGVVGNSGKDPYRQPTSAAQRLQFAKYIASLDPYGHAIVHHNWPDSEDETYGPLLGEDAFSGISLQAHYDYAAKTAQWTQRAQDAGRGWMFTVDEPLGWEFGARPDSSDADHRREIEGVLWPVLMSGGAGVDWYFGWQNNAPTSDLSNEDQRSRHELWVKSKSVREYFESTFDLSTLTVELNGVDIITRGKTHAGKDFVLTAKRTAPTLPEGEGHSPWEYALDSLTLEIDGTSKILNPINPAQ